MTKVNKINYIKMTKEELIEYLENRLKEAESVGKDEGYAFKSGYLLSVLETTLMQLKSE